MFSMWMNNLILIIQDNEIKIKRGVVMGCFLSPTLFNLYYSLVFIKNNFQNLDLLAYADDTTLICNTKELKNKYLLFKEKIEKNFLELNEHKTVILVNTDAIDEETKNFFSKRNIKITKEERLLGARISIMKDGIKSNNKIDPKIYGYVKELVKLPFKLRRRIFESKIHASANFDMICNLALGHSTDVARIIWNRAFRYTPSYLDVLTINKSILKMILAATKIKLYMKNQMEEKGKKKLIKIMNSFNRNSTKNKRDRVFNYKTINWEGIKWKSLEQEETEYQFKERYKRNVKLIFKKLEKAYIDCSSKNHDKEMLELYNLEICNKYECLLVFISNKMDGGF